MSLKVMTLVWEHAKVSGSELLVLLAMADFADDSGYNIYPSMTTLANKARLSESQARRTVQNLVQEGLIEIVEGGGWDGRRNRSNEYHIILDNDHLSPAGGGNAMTPPSADATTGGSKMTPPPSRPRDHGGRAHATTRGRAGATTVVAPTRPDPLLDPPLDPSLNQNEMNEGTRAAEPQPDSFVPLASAHIIVSPPTPGGLATNLINGVVALPVPESLIPEKACPVGNPAPPNPSIAASLRAGTGAGTAIGRAIIAPAASTLAHPEGSRAAASGAAASASRLREPSGPGGSPRSGGYAESPLEQAISIALLTYVGMSDGDACTLASVHRLEYVERQVFAWKENFRVTKNYGDTGSLMRRFREDYSAAELTDADRDTDLYRRFHPEYTPISGYALPDFMQEAIADNLAVAKEREQAWAAESPIETAWRLTLRDLERTLGCHERLLGSRLEATDQEQACPVGDGKPFYRVRLVDERSVELVSRFVRSIAGALSGRLLQTVAVEIVAGESEAGP